MWFEAEGSISKLLALLPLDFVWIVLQIVCLNKHTGALRTCYSELCHLWAGHKTSVVKCVAHLWRQPSYHWHPEACQARRTRRLKNLPGKLASRWSHCLNFYLSCIKLEKNTEEKLVNRRNIRNFRKLSSMAIWKPVFSV